MPNIITYWCTCSLRESESIMSTLVLGAFSAHTRTNTARLAVLTENVSTREDIWHNHMVTYMVYSKQLFIPFVSIGTSRGRTVHRYFPLRIPLRIQPGSQLCRKYKLCQHEVDRLWKESDPVHLQHWHGQDQHGRLRGEIPARTMGELLSWESFETPTRKEE